MNSTDEYVMDSFCTFDKMKVLIYDLLCTEVWKEKLYPLLKGQLAQINSVRSYMTVSSTQLEITDPISTFLESSSNLAITLTLIAFRFIMKFQRATFWKF